VGVCSVNGAEANGTRGKRRAMAVVVAMAVAVVARRRKRAIRTVSDC